MLSSWGQSYTAQKHGFKLKALLSFSQPGFETGCFQARVSLHRPTAAYAGSSEEPAAPAAAQTAKEAISTAKRSIGDGAAWVVALISQSLLHTANRDSNTNEERGSQNEFPGFVQVASRRAAVPCAKIASFGHGHIVSTK